MSVNLKSLIGRLNDTCRQALEGAAGLCLSRTNYDVEVEHVLLKLLEAPDTDLAEDPPALRDRPVALREGPDARARPAQDGQRPDARPLAAAPAPDREGVGGRLDRLRRGAGCGRGTCSSPS